MSDISASLRAISEKAEARALARKARHEEKKEAITNGEKLLKCERTATGGYVVGFKGGGQLPECLKGTWTSVDRLRKQVVVKYGRDILET